MENANIFTDVVCNNFLTVILSCQIFCQRLETGEITHIQTGGRIIEL